jgi:hypothetical protein
MCIRGWPRYRNWDTGKSAPAWQQTLAYHDKNKDGKISQEEAPDPSLTKVWFLCDLGKDGFLDAKDWEYLLARNSTKNGLYAIKLGGRGTS